MTDGPFEPPPTEQATDHLSLRIRADPGPQATMMETVETFLEERGAPKPAFATLMLALDEIVANIVSHAYPADAADRFIQLDLLVDADGARIAIVDAGVSFDPLQACDPDTSLGIDECRVGGLGILLVKRLADSVTYARDGDLNRLSIVKRFG